MTGSIHFATRFIGIVCIIVNSAIAQDVATGTDKAQSESKERMAEMTSMIDRLKIEVEVDGKMQAAKRHPKALLRTIDRARKTSGNEDGSLWLWSHDGLPVAMVELWATTNIGDHNWGHTMLAVSQNDIHGIAESRKWTPKSGMGVKFETVPKGGKPHKKAFGRKIQMRNIARRFTANIEDPGRNNRQQFRLMPEPIHRYQGGEIQDGAIFAFVRGTSNPEVLLFVRLHNGQWEYGFLRCSSNELVAQLDKAEIWKAPQVPGWVGNPEGPFWVFRRRYEDTAEVN